MMNIANDNVPPIPGYRILEPLAEGTRTKVYRALHLDQYQAQHQPVIIKVLRHEHPSFGDLVQFRNQYAIAHFLAHPAILRPLALERCGNGYGLVMPDEGFQSLLAYWQRRQRLTTQTDNTVAVVLAIAIQLADVLHYLASQQIIHKDIKPDNILIHPHTQRIQLIDFSIASLLPKEQQQLASPSLLEGTLAYISPEQTGRMNRGIDYRTDFYSLGVTLFELLTGHLPFSTTDPMELVHCHIACPVEFPPHSQSVIPEMVRSLVLKLMAKNAEDRYQSALGLKYDLAHCQQQWKATAEIAPFTLGERDLGDRFLIPEKLYGRDEAVATLLDAFDRVATDHLDPDHLDPAPTPTSRSELLLVRGFSGIGKTAVINEIHKPILRRRGYFIKGKYDQFQRNLPFSALVQALQGLMVQLLGESDRRLSQWRTRIEEALGDNGQIIIDVIPELQQIIGPQPAVSQLEGVAAQNRFNLVFQQFIGALTAPDHPLVLFLDDLQWADTASLTLIKLLMTDAQVTHLLVIGAYRNNEVLPGHPLTLLIADLDPAIVHTLTLGSLRPQDIDDMVAATLSCSVTAAQPLAKLVYAKTQGNPFFAIRFLQALYGDRLIQFNPALGYWECDLAQIKPLAIQEDVVDFMTHQLQKLPVETQTVLKLAACVGNQFDLATLAIVADRPPGDVAIALWSALQTEMVLPGSEIYKFYQDPSSDDLDLELSPSFGLGVSPTLDPGGEQGFTLDPGAPGADTIPYRFLHDRVQQAAYKLIPEWEKPATHLRIGHRLRQVLPPAQQDDYLFAIANQLNQGRSLITDPTERIDLAHLNREASQKAKHCTAYQSALNYGITGIRCLSEQCWQQQYDLARSLHTLVTEVAYLCGEIDLMDRYAQVVLDHAHSLLDKIDVYNVKILAYTAANQPMAAVELGLQILDQLGIALPNTPTAADIQQTLAAVARLHPAEGIARLMDQADMSDRQALAALQILNAMFTPCYAIAPMMIPLISAIGARLSITYGNAPLSVIAYAGYAMLLCGVTNDIAAGYEFGQLALNLLPRFSNAAIQTRVMCMVAAFVLHWRSPLPTIIPTLKAAFQSGGETGDWQYTAWSYYHDCQVSYLAGQELIGLERKLMNYEQAMAQIKQDFQRDRSLMLHQVVLNLMGQNGDPCQISGTVYNEELARPYYDASHNTEALYFLAFHHMLLCFWFGDSAQALAAAQDAEEYLTSVPSQAVVPVFYFYDSLIRLAHYPHGTPSAQAQIMERVQANQTRLAHWSQFAPQNYQHQWTLVAAEEARVLGQIATAIDAYDQAIAQAKADGFIQAEALANELAAHFYLSRGKDKVAAGYMQEAYYSYACWGAKAKTDYLEATQPQLLRPILQQSYPDWSMADTLSLRSTVSLQSIAQDTQTPGVNVNAALDLSAIFKASQIISSTIDLEELLGQLTQILLHNSGGDRCAILLVEPDGHLRLGAIATINHTTVLDIPLTNSSNLPIQLIQYVKNTTKSVVMNGLINDSPVVDHYLMERDIASLLCLPLMDRTQLRGVLYLENQATIGVFHAERLVAVNLLATQAAIALENARLYHQAQCYAQQLEASQLQLVQSEKMSALGNLVAGIAHEINNPIGFVDGNIGQIQTALGNVTAYLALWERTFPTPGDEIHQARKMLDIEFLLDDLPKMLASMQVGCDRLRDISNSLRSFSRTDTLSRLSANLHDGINSTLLILKYRLQANDIRPAIDVIKDYGNLPDILCFPGQINQVFMNILANAIDMFDEMAEASSLQSIWDQPQQITIHTDQIDPRHIIICIRDNGKGMTQEMCAKIFDRTFTTKAVGKGTGLGLAIARQIIEDNHGGTLHVQSELGQGTEFMIQLPCLESDQHDI